MITTSDTMHSDKSYFILDNSSNDDFSTIEENTLAGLFSLLMD